MTRLYRQLLRLYQRRSFLHPELTLEMEAAIAAALGLA
jgi:hypothetical protein